jgi:hypothetical protein
MNDIFIVRKTLTFFINLTKKIDTIDNLDIDIDIFMKDIFIVRKTLIFFINLTKKN